MIKNYDKFMGPELIIEARISKVERTQLNIGDRVMTNGEVDGISIDYQTGKILNMREYGNLLIEFDKPFNKNLHAGFNNVGKPDHCLYVPLKNIYSNNPTEFEEIIKKVEDFERNKKKRMKETYKIGDVIVGVGKIKNGKQDLYVDGEIGLVFYQIDNNNFFIGFLDKFDNSLLFNHNIPKNGAGFNLNKINMRHALEEEIVGHEEKIRDIEKEIKKLGESYNINDIVVVDGKFSGLKFEDCIGIVRQFQHAVPAKNINYSIHFIKKYNQNLYDINYIIGEPMGFQVPGQYIRKATEEEIKENETKINQTLEKIAEFNYDYKVGDFVVTHNNPSQGFYDNLDSQIGEIVEIKNQQQFVVNFFNKINQYCHKFNNKYLYTMTLHRSMISIIKGGDGAEIKRKLDNKEIMIFITSEPLSMLLNRIELKPKTVLLNMSYFDIDKDKNDIITYLPIDRYKRLEKDDDPFKSKLRQPMKIGKFFRVLDENLKDKDVEIFINSFKSNYDMLIKGLTDTLQLVAGEDVRFWYNGKNYVQGGGTLNSSCMRGENKGPEMQMFVDNPDVCQLLILRDPKSLKLLGRALIWRLEEPKDKTFMDYVYTRYDKDRDLFIMYAKTRGWITRDSGRTPSMICALHTDKKYQQGVNALDHFDTFHLVSSENYLTNGSAKGFKNPYMTKNGGKPDSNKKIPEDVIVKEDDKKVVEKPIEKPVQFKEGDKVIYKKAKSEYNDKIATFIKIREDGKYSIVFEDGHKLATFAKYLFPIEEKK